MAAADFSFLVIFPASLCTFGLDFWNVSRETFWEIFWVEVGIGLFYRYLGSMSNQPKPEQLVAIARKASELLEMMDELGATRIGYFNPNPEGLPDLPWSKTTLSHLCDDLYSVSSLLGDEVEQEEWGITWEMVNE